MRVVAAEHVADPAGTCEAIVEKIREVLPWTTAVPLPPNRDLDYAKCIHLDLYDLFEEGALLRRVASRQIALLCLGLAVMAGTAHAQTKLSYGSYLPPTHVNNTVGIEPMIKRLEQESGGKLTVEFFPGGSVAKATAAVDSIRDGIVTAGMIVDTYVPKQLPHSFLITELGLLGRNSVAMAGAMPSILSTSGFSIRSRNWRA